MQRATWSLPAGSALRPPASSRSAASSRRLHRYSTDTATDRDRRHCRAAAARKSGRHQPCRHRQHHPDLRVERQSDRDLRERSDRRRYLAPEYAACRFLHDGKAVPASACARDRHGPNACTGYSGPGHAHRHGTRLCPQIRHTSRNFHRRRIHVP